MWWTLLFQQKCLLLEFCRPFDPHSYIISLHLYMTNVTNELRSSSLQNLRIFVEAAKFTTLQMHTSLLVFIFWRSARYYPQCIINWQLQKGLLDIGIKITVFLHYFGKRYNQPFCPIDFVVGTCLVFQKIYISFCQLWVLMLWWDWHLK